MFEIKTVSMNNVLNVDLNEGFQFYLTNLSNEIIPLVYPFEGDSSQEWNEFHKFIDKEVIAKIIPDGGDIYNLYTSYHKHLVSFDCIDLSKAFDKHGRPMSNHSVVDHYRKMNSEHTNQ